MKRFALSILAIVALALCGAQARADGRGFGGVAVRDGFGNRVFVGGGFGRGFSVGFGGAAFVGPGVVSATPGFIGPHVILQQAVPSISVVTPGVQFIGSSVPQVIVQQAVPSISVVTPGVQFNVVQPFVGFRAGLFGRRVFIVP